jgi:hypothetical protein
MDSDQFISMNFEDALSIAALCSDLGISQDDARLYIYIHAKSCSHPSGIQCFIHEKEEEILALEIMLGIKNIAVLFPEKGSDAIATVLQKFGTFTKDSISDLDHIARHGCGHETHFQSELSKRLKFHTDEKFRNEKLQIFSAVILPRMKEYGKEKALSVFETKRKKPPVIVLNFRDSLN